MLSILFHRQDSGHVGQGHVWLVFQEIPQEIKVLLLQCLGLLPFTHHAVPLIYQDDELPVRFCVNLPQSSSKPYVLPF